MRSTRLVDLDGTCLNHVGGLPEILKGKQYLLPGVLDEFRRWRENDDHIVITTARSESLRNFTERQLDELGLFWDQMVMGLPVGPRYVYNDTKPATNEHSEMITAYAVPMVRDKGFGHTTYGVVKTTAPQGDIKDVEINLDKLMMEHWDKHGYTIYYQNGEIYSEVFDTVTFYELPDCGPYRIWNDELWVRV